MNLRVHVACKLCVTANGSYSSVAILCLSLLQLYVWLLCRVLILLFCLLRPFLVYSHLAKDKRDGAWL